MAARKQKTEEEKRFDIFNTILTKLVNMFNDIYITKTGHIISMDKENPFLVELYDESLDIIKEFLLGDKNIIHIINLRKFKKDLEYEYIREIGQTEKLAFYERLNRYTSYINLIDKWKPFIFSEDEEKNLESMTAIFKDNKYLSFKDDEVDGPSIIFTKELVPMATVKNFENIEFRTIELKEVNEEYDGLYLITFKFNYDLFIVYSLNLFIDY